MAGAKVSSVVYEERGAGKGCGGEGEMPSRMVRISETEKTTSGSNVKSASRSTTCNKRTITTRSMATASATIGMENKDDDEEVESKLAKIEMEEEKLEDGHEEATVEDQGVVSDKGRVGLEDGPCEWTCEEEWLCCGSALACERQPYWEMLNGASSWLGQAEAEKEEEKLEDGREETKVARKIEAEGEKLEDSHEEAKVDNKVEADEEEKKKEDEKPMADEEGEKNAAEDQGIFRDKGKAGLEDQPLICTYDEEWLWCGSASEPAWERQPYWGMLNGAPSRLGLADAEEEEEEKQDVPWRLDGIWS